ncbi:hypothetical protein OOK39_21825 [Streptomyces sp. NBC_00264]|uniref:Rmf/CrpP fold protein n=1 Tax=unclassified Streptomyces TaxID=2593676 RepID=UPI00225780CF|nr:MULTISPECIES: Rmf/CrpP fold protein [unclassified Streptomyces]MCX5161878.1 hypothetical protein [Streptomyces sp. NBC_00305]MCX5220401.1 hypothetical protein [Streptomyces sp. NBC_00264]
MGTRENIAQAIAAGAEAGARGDRPTACPYGAESLLRTAWIRGYARARPLAEQDRAE